MIQLSKSLGLPLEAVTQTFAILAQRGAGKSYTASVMAEDMLAAHQRVCILDPTGAWWGLQASADGKHAGCEIVVIGGDHGNIALSDTAGEVLARAIASRRFSAVLDLSLFRKGQMRRFVADFLENLYRVNREPLHVFIDEADEVAPQRVGPEEARMVGAAEDLVKRGRKKGIGCTLITQRPADIAKQVLTQVGTLIAMRMNHPRDINAIKEWVAVNANEREAAKMISTLPSLPIGEAWIWSPGWMELFQRIHVRKRRTFDSGATPKVGEKAIAPSALTPIDVEALGEEIAATIQEQEASDPKRLKARIVELERDLRAAKATAKPVIPPAVGAGLIEINKRLDAHADLMRKSESELTETQKRMRALNDLLGGDLNGLVCTPSALREAVDRVAAVARVKNVKRVQSVGMPAPRRRILNALAYMESLGVTQMLKTQLAFFADASPRSSAFQNNVSALHVAGLIQYPQPGWVRLTDAGGAEADPQNAPMTNQELCEMVLCKLPAPRRKILEHLIGIYPKAVTSEELAEAVGASVRSSAFQNNKSGLHVLGVVDYPERGMVAASVKLFPFTH